jgi:hypothetical protein
VSSTRNYVKKKEMAISFFDTKVCIKEYKSLGEKRKEYKFQ